MISDSGSRRSFESGAVRDIQDGKGRPSLMPMEVVYMLLNRDDIMYCLGYFKDDRSPVHLYDALRFFSSMAYNGSDETMLMEVSKHFEEGHKKYPPAEDGTPNWQLGIPVDCYMDSAIRHYLKWRRGDKDEPHDRAFVWNIMCCIWEIEVHEKEGA